MKKLIIGLTILTGCVTTAGSPKTDISPRTDVTTKADKIEVRDSKAVEVHDSSVVRIETPARPARETRTISETTTIREETPDAVIITSKTIITEAIPDNTNLELLTAIAGLILLIKTGTPLGYIILFVVFVLAIIFRKQIAYAIKNKMKGRK